MERIQVEYQVTVSDFHKATYFGVFLRHRKPLQIMFVVLIVGVLYSIAGTMGFGAINPLVLFLAAAYLVWGLLLFAGTERDIRRYLRTPDSFVGCKYRLTLESHRIRIDIPERSASASFQISQLACVFELSQLFLIYSSQTQVYILPTRCLTAQQRTALRENFRERLGDRFSTRFK